MPETLKFYKPLTTDDVFKGYVESFGSFVTLANTGLTWNMVERGSETWSDTTDEMKNLFTSFGLSRQDDNDWYTSVAGVADAFNATRMIIINDPNFSGGVIDGATLRINVPTGLTASDYVTFYGSNYVATHFNDNAGTEYNAGVRQILENYGSAVAFLFANTGGSGALPTNTYESGWHMPYSGYVNGTPNPNLDFTASWIADSTNRSAPHIRANSVIRATDLGYDAPYGIAFLEKGLFVIFDFSNSRTDFISNVPYLYDGASVVWNANSAGVFVASIAGSQNTDEDIRKHVVFSGTGANASANVSYRKVDRSYKLTYFCHAGTSEFNSTSNHTYDHEKGYFTPSQADSLYITEIALYGNDTSKGPIAYAKLSTPVKKDVLETMTFKVSLEL